MYPVHARLGEHPGRGMPAAVLTVSLLVLFLLVGGFAPANAPGSDDPVLTDDPVPTDTADVVAPQERPPLQPAESADESVERIGVNTQFTDTEPTHCQLVPVLTSAVRALRVRHIRDNVSTWDRANTTCTWVENGRLRTARGVDILASLAPQARSLLVVNALSKVTQAQLLSDDAILRRVSREGPDNDVLDLAEQLRRLGALEGLEHTNEFDLSLLRTFRIGSTLIHPWVNQLRANTVGVNRLLRQRPALADLPLVGPSFGRDASYEAYSEGFDTTAHQTAGNLHYYANGFMPEKSDDYRSGRLDDAVATAKAASPGQPLYVTEAGYHTAPDARGYQGDYTGASEMAASVYLPRMFLGLRNGGADRVYLFQLRDRRNLGPTDQESYFGLLRWDGSKRPAFGAVTRLISTLDDPGPAYTPAPLRYSVNNPTGDVQSRLYGRRDGSYVLAIWRAVPVWDPLTRSPLDVRPARVGITLDEPEAFDAIYARLQDGGPTATAPKWRAARRAAGPIQVDLSGDVHLVKLIPRR